MKNFTGLAPLAVRAALAVTFASSFSSPVLAVETHVWVQSELSDFERGTLQNLSVRSDGRLTLAPEFKELLDAGVPYLWSVVRDSKGTLYAAGGAPTGATAKIFAIRNGQASAPAKADAQVKAFAEIPGLEIHVLAVDEKDNLYAAVLPDAKIYRIDATGKSELFYDTKQKYVWAMAFDHGGNLFVATGDNGIVYKVTPDGHGSEFFRTEETHARSLIVDKNDNVIVGTEPSGLVLRISPKGESFVLFQTAKREVTTVAEHDGVYFAASVGQKPVSQSPAPGPVLAPIAPAAGALRTGAAQPGAATVPGPAPNPAPSVVFPSNVSGGSDFYRIEGNGFAERLWSSPTEIVYAIGFDREGKPLIGTGNKGIIYRVDSDILSTRLLSAAPTQVTGFAQGAKGMLYAVTANVGKVYSIGPGFEGKGTLESEVLDAGEFTYWGKAHVKSESNGGTVQLESRSGNLSRPQKNWSEWSGVPVTANGGAVSSPAARFLQYRLTLKIGPQAASPETTAVEVAYQAKNVAPKVRLVQVEAANYRLSSSVTLERLVQPSGSPSILSLPPLGQRKTAAAAPVSDIAGGVTLQYAKGWLTARWNATDENGDGLIYKVEIRGAGEASWRLLKDKVTERQLSWDGGAFPDGEYRLRVTASDAPTNTPADALTSSLESDVFTIDNTPPEILNGKVTQGTIAFTAKDALSWLDKAEYSVNGGEWTLLDPVNRVSDSPVLDYKLTLPPGGDTPRIVAIRVFDENDNVVVSRYTAP